MSFIYNQSLKSLNTFGIDVVAKQFASFDNIESLREKIKLIKPDDNVLVLGGGSNILFTKDFSGIVLKNEIRGITALESSKDFYFIKCGAGENWHDLVMHCVENNYQGIENLALIPGCVGAAPMQNIGAYGVELKDIFHSLEAIEIATGELHTFNLSDCNFGYRDSVFKNVAKNKFIIVSVTLKLNKIPNFKIDYGDLKSVLSSFNSPEITMKSIANAVISIRSSKLPDPKQIGNAGSFFKNPVIQIEHFNRIKITHPAIIGYPINDSLIKVAAGWLIENDGWKGKIIDNFGVHKNQALVLVNYGGANGQNILDLSQKIMDSIFQNFGILLEREVNIY